MGMKRVLGKFCDIINTESNEVGTELISSDEEGEVNAGINANMECEMLKAQNSEQKNVLGKQGNNDSMLDCIDASGAAAEGRKLTPVKARNLSSCEEYQTAGMAQ
ncbi:hypothetical protein HPP92_007838 [Vanilla planifolia]|uniref:Uncharacterized protein n=1 Tax=Vanilla planifolia TaxID=51239 RepID=A0A835RN61_VANPL|nr:hypothetical protein HPP92_007838 [Vanilla planifolia]